MQHFNCKVQIGFSWFHVGKSMDELHPPMCHVIRGVELKLWLSFRYITTNVTHVMSLKKGMEFWNFDYYSIILKPMEHWHMSYGHSWCTIKLNYLTCAMCMVSKSWNYWFIKNVSIWYCATRTLMLHTCMTHGILLFLGHQTYVNLNQSKEINYKVVENMFK